MWGDTKKILLISQLNLRCGCFHHLPQRPSKQTPAHMSLLDHTLKGTALYFPEFQHLLFIVSPPLSGCLSIPSSLSASPYHPLWFSGKQVQGGVSSTHAHTDWHVQTLHAWCLLLPRLPLTRTCGQSMQGISFCLHSCSVFKLRSKYSLSSMWKPEQWSSQTIPGATEWPISYIHFQNKAQQRDIENNHECM